MEYMLYNYLMYIDTDKTLSLKDLKRIVCTVTVTCIVILIFNIVAKYRHFKGGTRCKFTQTDIHNMKVLDNTIR